MSDSVFSVSSQPSCPTNSKSSMLTVSVGKRVQGDAMAMRELKDEPPPASDRNSRVLRLTNARNVYSITVSHISWEAQNLAKAFKPKRVVVVVQLETQTQTRSAEGSRTNLTRPAVPLLSSFQPLVSTLSRRVVSRQETFSVRVGEPTTFHKTRAGQLRRTLTIVLH